MPSPPAARLREIVQLAPQARLQRGDSDAATTLIVESGATVQLNEYAAAILALCDGTRSADDIAEEMLHGETPADSPREDVLEFIEAAIALRWVMLASSKQT